MSTTPSTPRGGGGGFGTAGGIRERPLSDDKKSYLVYTLRPTSAAGVWWPCRGLEGVETKGHLICDSHALIILLQGGAGGVLTLCTECTKIQDTNYKKGGVAIVEVPWNQLTGVVSVTSSVLLISITVTVTAAYTGSNGGQGRGLSVTSSSTRTSTDLLIAPCPSSALHRLMVQRLDMSTLRERVKVLVKAAAPTIGDSSRIIQDPILPAARALATSLSLYTNFNCHRGLDGYNDEYTHNQGNIDGVSKYSVPFNSRPSRSTGFARSSDRNVDSDGEEGPQGGLETCLRRGDNEVRGTEGDLIWALRLKQFNRCLRSHMYLAVVVQICSSYGGKETDTSEYSLSAVEEMVDKDCVSANANTTFLSRIGDENISLSMFNKFELIRLSAERRILDYCLCYATSMTEEGEGKWRASKTLTPVGKPAVGSGAVLGALINGYRNALRLVLFPYVGSKESFIRCNGQEFRSGLVALLLRYNDCLNGYVSRALALVGKEMYICIYAYILKQ